MRSDLLAHLDALWAQHLRCQPAHLHNENTNIIAEPSQTGVEVWLFGKTCVMLAAPPLAQAIQTSVGTRNPIVAFEPSRLRAALSFFNLELYGPEAVLVKADSGTHTSSLAWLPPCESVPDLEAATRGVAERAIPATTLSLKQRPARRAAEACGFELYASVIYIGHKPEHPNL
jgi:hypothetical protein